jgi:hypothetical protein
MHNPPRVGAKRKAVSVQNRAVVLTSPRKNGHAPQIRNKKTRKNILTSSLKCGTILLRRHHFALRANAFASWWFSTERLVRCAVGDFVLVLIRAVAVYASARVVLRLQALRGLKIPFAESHKADRRTISRADDLLPLVPFTGGFMG